MKFSCDLPIDFDDNKVEFSTNEAIMNMAQAMEKAGAIRSLPLLLHRNYQESPMRLFLALGVTVRTAPRTLRAAMWMATPLPGCRHRESRLRRCCKKIMLILRWKRQTGLFLLAQPAQMSTMLRCC